MIYICIPTHNEQQTVGVVLWKLRQVLTEYPRDYQLLVADDASTDRTQEVLEPYTRVLPLTVIRSDRQQGHGASLEMLLREASRRSEYPKRDIVITLQADFSEEPDDIVALLKRMEAGADVAVGTKVTTRKQTAMRRLARKLSGFFVRGQQWPEGMPHPFDGYRAYRMQAVKKAIEEREGRRLLRYDGWAGHAELLRAVLPHARRVDVVEVEDRSDRMQRPSRERPLAAAMQVRAMMRNAEPGGLAGVEELDRLAATASRARERTAANGNGRRPQAAAGGRDTRTRERGRGEARGRGEGRREESRPRAAEGRSRSGESRSGEARGRGSAESRRRGTGEVRSGEGQQRRRERSAGQQRTGGEERQGRQRQRRQPDGAAAAAGSAEAPEGLDPQQAGLPGVAPAGDAPHVAAESAALVGDAEMTAAEGGSSGAAGEGATGEAGTAGGQRKRRRRRRGRGGSRSRSGSADAGQDGGVPEAGQDGSEPGADGERNDGGEAVAGEGQPAGERKRRRRGGRRAGRGRRRQAEGEAGAGGEGTQMDGNGGGGGFEPAPASAASAPEPGPDRE